MPIPHLRRPGLLLLLGLLLPLLASMALNARFRTVAMVCFPDGREVAAEGVLDGEITTVARGANGFGYDPVFAPAGAGGRTFAEMTAGEKNALSHRGRAFRALASLLAAEPS